MTRRERNFLAVGLGAGAWIFPVAGLIAARYSHRHFLAIVTKEKP